MSLMSVSACPLCGEQGGFHSADCGHFTKPASWNLAHYHPDEDYLLAAFDTPDGPKWMRWYYAIPPRPSWAP